jgi:hypothetical protein
MMIAINKKIRQKKGRSGTGGFDQISRDAHETAGDNIAEIAGGRQCWLGKCESFAPAISV